MKKNILILSLAFVLSFSLQGIVAAQEEKYLSDLFPDLSAKANVQITGTTAIYSKYMWRGMRLDNDPVLQPSVNINAFGGWNLNVWGNFDVDNSADALNSNEVDTTLTYTHKLQDLRIADWALRPVSVTVGHVYYDFPGTNTFSKESILGFGYETFLAPNFTWYHDYSRESQGGGDGDYLMLGLSHSVPVAPDYGVTLDFSGHVGYNRRLFMRGEGGDVLLTTGVTVPITKNLKMSPTVNWNAPFGSLADEDDGNREAEYFWGTTASYTF